MLSDEEKEIYDMFTTWIKNNESNINAEDSFQTFVKQFNSPQGLELSDL